MPNLIRPHRYSPPKADLLRKTSANHKIKKMLPHRHPSRAALKANTPQQHPRQAAVYQSDHDTTRSYYQANYSHHGQRTQQEYGEGEDGRYGAEGYYYGGEPDRRFWAAQAGPGRRDRDDYRDDYRDDRQDGRHAADQVQSQVPQQGHYYQQAQSHAAGGQQYWDQAGYNQSVHSTAPAWQGYWPGYQHYYDPAYYRQQASYAPTYPQASYRQEVYVPDHSYFYQQPPQYGYQQQQYLTQDWYTANNLNANASTFQPQVTNRVPPTPINFVPGTTLQQDARFSSASPSKNDKFPHFHALKRPSPTEDYLKNASQAVQTLEQPRQLLVVLDLNGTLLFRKPKGGSTFVARPKVNEFTHYLLSNHRVMVWSSARPDNVNPMCQKLFDVEQHQRLVGVWARDTLRIPSHAYKQKVQVYKQLSWIWKDEGVQSANLDAAGVWDQSNTVLIDDSMDKAASEPHNLICLEEFQDRPDQQQSDVLGQVVKYLETLKHEEDVSAFMRVMPFTYNEGEVFDWNV